MGFKAPGLGELRLRIQDFMITVFDCRVKTYAGKPETLNPKP